MDSTWPWRRTRKTRTSNSRAVEADLLCSAPHPALSGIHPESAHFHRCRGPPGGPPQEGRDARNQHREGERLGQVVIGPGVQRLGLVHVTVLGGEHQDGGPVAGIAQVGTDLVAVATRQHDVQDDQVEALLGGPPQAIQPVVGHIDGEPLGLEPALDGGRDLAVVLDQQELHTRSVPALT